MERSTSPLEAAIVRIRDEEGRVVGAGFLVGPREVLTCAHVVARAGAELDGKVESPGAQLRLEFPLIAPGETFAAEVVTWQASRPDETGDMAALRLSVDPPPQAQPVRLIAVLDLWNHPFRTFGFPPGNDDGVWASGRLLGRQATGWIQLDDDRSAGFAVGPGFSGSPVWDAELDGVVGMAVAAEARDVLRTGYLLPASTLLDFWPALLPQILPACPYRGLASFREQDAHLFHGRQELAIELARWVDRTCLVAVVGPSGSGKSSLVFAGALPKVRARSGRIVVSLRPAGGASPLGALAGALLPFLEPETSETDRMDKLPKLASVLKQGRLAEVVDRLLQRSASEELLIIIDQAEELFARGREEAHSFLDTLLKALQSQSNDGSRNLRILLTLRADFLGEALEHPELAEALRDSVFPAGQMTREQLRQAIEEPAAGIAAYEHGLVERILDDLGSEPGKLPLLEFALTILWERQEGGMLTHAAYEEIGEVAGALARYAEGVYLDDLREPERTGAQRILTQLVRPAEEAEPTRRIARRADFDENQWRIAQKLAATRLIVTNSDPDGEETVELAHEALISRWTRLRRWVDADRDFRIWQERLRIALAQWLESGRDKGALLSRVPLAEAEEWLAVRPTEVSANEHAFIQASRIRHRRAVQRLQALMATISVLLLVAVLLSLQTLRLNRAERDKGARLATRVLTDEARSRAETNPERSILLSIAALQTKETTESRSSLFEQYQRYQDVAAILPGHTGRVTDFALSRDGRTMASVDVRGTVLLWDLLAKPGPASTQLTKPGDIVAISLSPDGQALATGSSNGTIRIWNVALRSPSGAPLNAGPGRVAELALSADHRTLASVSTSEKGQIKNQVSVWDLATNARSQTLSLPYDDNSDEGYEELREIELTFGPTGSGLLVAVGSTLSDYGGSLPAIVWNLTAQTTHVLPFESPVESLRASAVSPDGGHLAVIENDSTAWTDTSIGIWDVRTQQRVRSIPLEGTLIGLGPRLAWDEGGDRLAMASQEGLLVWDTVRGYPVGGLTMPAFYGDVAFGPDSETLVISASENILLLRSQFAAPQDVSGILASGVAIDSDGQRIAAIDSRDGAVTMWDTATRTRIGEPAYPRSGEVDWASPLSIAISSNGATLATTIPNEQAIYIWSIHRDQIQFREKLDVTEVTAPPKPFQVSQLQFMPDGTLLTSTAGRISRWDLSKHQRLGQPLNVGGDEERDRLGASVAMFSLRPNTQEIAARSIPSPIIKLWDLGTGQEKSHLPTTIGGDITGLSFSHNGKVLAVADSRNVITLWDVDHSKRIGRSLPTAGTFLALTPDAQRLIAITQNRASMWDLGNGTKIIDAAFYGGQPIDLMPNSQAIVSIDDSHIQFTKLDDVAVWMRTLCHIVRHDLSKADWQSVGLADWSRPLCK